MIDREKIKHLAILARLTLSEEEIEKLANHLERILKYVDKINELNLEKESPLFSLLEAQELREDQIQQNLNSESIKNNFPERNGDYLKVPKIL